MCNFMRCSFYDISLCIITFFCMSMYNTIFEADHPAGQPLSIGISTVHYLTRSPSKSTTYEGQIFKILVILWPL